MIVKLTRNFEREYGREKGTFPQPSSGTARWINTLGYHLKKVRDVPYLWTTKAVYECKLTHVMPLTFLDAGGNQWRTEPLFQTDMGTIPLTAQLVIPKDRGLLSYLMHDNACTTGQLYRKEYCGKSWILTNMGRSERDNLLYDCLIAEGIGQCQARAVWMGIRSWAIASGQWG